jgi:hypothetical protein
MGFFGKIAKAMNPINQAKGAIGLGKSLVKGDVKGAVKGSLQTAATGSPWGAKLQAQAGRSRVQGTRPAPQAGPAMMGAPPQQPAVAPGAPGGFSRVAPAAMGMAEMAPAGPGPGFGAKSAPDMASMGMALQGGGGWS